MPDVGASQPRVQLKLKSWFWHQINSNAWEASIQTFGHGPISRSSQQDTSNQKMWGGGNSDEDRCWELDGRHPGEVAGATSSGSPSLC